MHQLADVLGDASGERVDRSSSSGPVNDPSQPESIARVGYWLSRKQPSSWRIVRYVNEEGPWEVEMTPAIAKLLGDGKLFRAFPSVAVAKPQDCVVAS